MTAPSPCDETLIECTPTDSEIDFDLEVPVKHIILPWALTPSPFFGPEKLSFLQCNNWHIALPLEQHQMKRQALSSRKQLAAEEHYLAPLSGIIADVSILSLAGSSADAQVSSTPAVSEIWEVSSDDEPNVTITKEERPSIRRMNAQHFAESPSSVSGFSPNQNCYVRWLTFVTMEAFLGNEQAIDNYKRGEGERDPMGP